LTRKIVTATGYIPSKASPRVRRQIEAVVKKETPPDFFKHAIYSAGDINLIGNKYKVEGDPNGYSDILYADSLNWDVSKDGVESNPIDVDADEQQDASIKPLARLEFEILRNLAMAQGNYYDADRIKDVETSKDSYPSCGSCSDCPGLPEGADCCFWHSCPTDPLDPSTGVPKVVYVEGDLVLNGNIGEIGGFFVVVGNVLTDPEDTGDSTINGNGDVRGCIYSTGKFNINGGGGDLNVDGGVWAGSEAEMKGSSNLFYNATFMDAIKAMIEREGVGPAVQIVSWREIE
jgi:hypothetical protein